MPTRYKSDNSRRPLQLAAWPVSGDKARHLNAVVWAFVALGVTLRLMRYLLRFPLWGDECMVAANLFDRSYAGLAAPLDYNQICPLGFMWTELTAVKLFGFNEWSLRLFPTFCSLASVFLFRRIAVQLLSGSPLLLAVGIFSVAYYPIRHGAELKPYAVDLCVALILLSLTIDWLQTGQSRFGWGLAAFAPLALGFSNPALFVAGAASLTVVVAAWRGQVRKAWPAWLALNLSLAATFLTLFLTVIQAQSAAAKAGGVDAMWAQSFPPLAAPWKVPLWLIEVHAGRMLAYPAGGEHGASLLTTVCCLAGVVVTWRRMEHWVSCLLLGPFALGLAAACAGAYPYGGTARTMQYVAPAICLLAGIGLAAVLGSRFWKHLGAPPQRWVVAVAIIALIGLISGARDLIQPYKTPYDQAQHAFARWLWRDLGRDGQVACVVQDLQVPLLPKFGPRAMSADYLCLQRLYSQRHQHGPCPPAWDQISVDRPLWCVLNSCKGVQPDSAALASWLAQMSTDYDLTSSIHLPLCVGGGVVFDQWYELYRFVPNADRARPCKTHRGFVAQ